MSKCIFVTGTGTDVGKTYVTGLMVKKLKGAGLSCGYYKAAMSGNDIGADEVLPAILVRGKVLTGGYIGHAATIANKKVYEGFLGDNSEMPLMHGPTFMGNALACSVALKSIELFENGDYMSRIKHIEAFTREYMKDLEDQRIKEVRIMGGCVCVEVNDSETCSDGLPGGSGNDSDSIKERPMGSHYCRTCRNICSKTGVGSYIRCCMAAIGCRGYAGNGIYCYSCACFDGDS